MWLLEFRLSIPRNFVSKYTVLHLNQNINREQELRINSTVFLLWSRSYNSSKLLRYIVIHIMPCHLFTKHPVFIQIISKDEFSSGKAVCADFTRLLHTKLYSSKIVLRWNILSCGPFFLKNISALQDLRLARHAVMSKRWCTGKSR